MSKFHSTFALVGNSNDFSPTVWQPFFDTAYSDLWERDQTGAIQCLTEEGERYSLILNYKKDESISISFDRYNRNDFSRNFSFISQGNKTLGSGFEYLPNGATVPTDSFLSLNDAWVAVNEFLRQPTKKPSSINWVDSNELIWPEDY